MGRGSWTGSGRVDWKWGVLSLGGSGDVVVGGVARRVGSEWVYGGRGGLLRRRGRGGWHVCVWGSERGKGLLRVEWGRSWGGRVNLVEVV